MFGRQRSYPYRGDAARKGRSIRSSKIAGIAATGLFALAAHSAFAQTAPVAVAGTGTYTAACPVVLDQVTGQPMACGPDSSFAKAVGGGSLGSVIPWPPAHTASPSATVPASALP